jgi:hypothetical protein
MLQNKSWSLILRWILWNVFKEQKKDKRFEVEIAGATSLKSKWEYGLDSFGTW